MAIVRHPFGPSQGFVHGIALQNVIAANRFPALDVWTINHFAFAVGKVANRLSFAARAQSDRVDKLVLFSELSFQRHVLLINAFRLAGWGGCPCPFDLREYE